MTKASRRIGDITISIDITSEEAIERIRELYFKLEGPFNGQTKKESISDLGDRGHKVRKRQVDSLMKAVNFLDRYKSADRDIE